MHRLRAVLFDLDGTLLDSLRAHHGVYRQVFAALGVPLDDASYARHYSPNWYLFYERMGVPAARWPEADRLWLQYYAQEAPPPRAGAQDILTAVRESSLGLGLVTSGDRSRVERDIRRAGWESAFDVVVCGGDLPQRKPHPEPLLHALEALRVPAYAALYVGDTIEDVTMGQAAGVRTAAVLGGFTSRDVLAAASPDYLLESLPDLTVLLL